MDLTIVGPGRAGMSLALAAVAAGHTVGAVVGRTPTTVATAAERLGAVARSPGEPLPATDLTVIAVRDDAIEPVAAELAVADLAAGAAVHLSGLASIATLGPLSDLGIPIGSFHPLQTFPTRDEGAAPWRGCWVAVTTEGGALGKRLADLAISLGSRPFPLEDEMKSAYHAAASAAANFPLAAFAMADDLFAAAGVPFEASRPLVAAVVANAYDLGPRAALTGPVARGDTGTVGSQIEAVAATDPTLLPGFVAFVAQLARLTGRGEDFAVMIAEATRRMD